LEWKTQRSGLQLADDVYKKKYEKSYKVKGYSFKFEDGAPLKTQ
jgi:hypothetical protein